MVDATRPSGVDMGAEAGPSAVEENAGDFENEDDIVFEERSLDSDADQGGSESSEHRPDEPGDVGRGEPDVHALSGEASGLEEPGSLEGHVDNSSSPPVRPSLAPHLRPWRPRATPDSPVRDARRRHLALLRRRVLPLLRAEDGHAEEEDGDAVGGGIGPMDFGRRREADLERRRRGDGDVHAGDEHAGDEHGGEPAAPGDPAT